MDNSQIEEKLDQIVRVKGERRLNEFRDSARGIGSQLAMGKEFEKLNRMIRAMLSTKPSDILKSSVAIARALEHS
ncbi:hypothetical protein GCM10011418_08970 [Sphingobacterium alkalisoli]|nr:hypothetical protein GCM10011418_08970 [Sphingobacterium alkalisoli]